MRSVTTVLCLSLLGLMIVSARLKGLETAGCDLAEGCGASLRKLSSPSGYEPDGVELFWSDEFDGTSLDATKWDYRTDTKHYSCSESANVDVDSGKLRIVLKKTPTGSSCSKPFIGGGVASKKALGPGYYEAKVKFPSLAGSAVPGWWTAFWLSTLDASQLSAGTAVDPWQEFDIFEHITGTDKTDSTIIKWRPGTETFIQAHERNTQWTEHVFGFLLSKDEALFFVDGRQIATFLLKPFGMHTELTTQHVWLTAIVHERTFPFADPSLPESFMEVDYFRYFRFARGGGEQISATSPETITLPSYSTPWSTLPPSSGKTNKLSAAAYVKNMHTNTDASILKLGTTGGSETFSMKAQNNDLVVSVLGSTCTATGFFSDTNSDWYHIGVVWNGVSGSVEIYKTKKGSFVTSHPPVKTCSGVAVDLLVDKDGDAIVGGGTGVTQGSIAGVKVWDGALSQSALSAAEAVGKPDYCQWRSPISGSTTSGACGGSAAGWLMCDTWPDSQYGNMLDFTLESTAGRMGVSKICSDYYA
uniref:GH16 domain-containing protein n=1 Tax=Chromera velia CCMP2878 TaxID=1169474 RepID=A0A0G4F726_9ALVE|mmetsp:Transcript_48269/g.95272  ORF Transcript_48269/g.95272 Transcript_48269/m.95272 type:complete len:530 (-) Transcript_48269:927-2516(-)|eukprot:Cvel_15585.t1-p1 / transcript=Cvel_15585.t1 / gene=Cvel_15585 / organism=Chromera_velia_CCMP2878 / gene_product=Kappa-carrageenase, putative / transcript_product=Kappa-carrageenase, putative / location=Cvel_scaffold1159:4594-10133(-) / protein_length=529 / sequence_SO=supercontig / SO=protein_coding / is_pseudo=false